MFGNDRKAMRVRLLIESVGFSVPRGISTTGFYNNIRSCETLQPSLTTVNLPYYEIGCRAAQLQYKLELEDPDETLEKVHCELVI